MSNLKNSFSLNDKNCSRLITSPLLYSSNSKAGRPSVPLPHSDSKAMRGRLSVRSFGDCLGPTNATASFVVVQRWRVSAAVEEVRRYSLKVLWSYDIADRNLCNCKIWISSGQCKIWIWDLRFWEETNRSFISMAKFFKVPSMDSSVSEIDSKFSAFVTSTCCCIPSRLFDINGGEDSAFISTCSVIWAAKKRSNILRFLLCLFKFVALK